MRKLTLTVVGLVVMGSALILGKSQEIAAAPGGGWTAADFKGTYVGHFNGGQVNFDALGNEAVATRRACSGIVTIVADGVSGLTVTLTYSPGPAQLDSTTPPGLLTYFVDNEGQVTCQDFPAGIFFKLAGKLSDRGNTVTFVLTNKRFTAGGLADHALDGSGVATIQ